MSYKYYKYEFKTNSHPSVEETGMTARKVKSAESRTTESATPVLK
jgi:hypothetical protein